jgi:DNA polymerase alpha subunit B
MFPGNFESLHDTCLISTRLREAVASASGFEWLDEAQPGSVRSKFGYVATQPGSKLKFSVSTEVRAGQTAGGVMLELAHLKSYEGMGRAVLLCEGGCKCDAAVVDGHHKQQVSQTYLHSVRVSQAAECVLSLTLLPGTSSGAHKFKVVGLIISEEAGFVGASDLVGNMVEWSSNVALKQGNGIFDAKNLRQQLVA